MSGPDIVWLLREVAEAIQDEQIAWHGGQDGIRDAGLLESAVARPHNLVVYGNPHFPALAASLGYDIARNHPFLGGNKRTAFVVVEAFLQLNGLTLMASDADCVLTIEGLARGSLSEVDFAAWIRANA